jgi:hypothetical protein
MPSFAWELGYLRAGLGELERYLLSKTLFWPLSAAQLTGDLAYPRLTLGNLLLSLARAKAWGIESLEGLDIKRIEDQLYALRTHWRVAWERKAGWEFQSRLRQWGHFLNETRQDIENQAVYYPYEVRLRVILGLIKEDINSIDSALLNTLDGLDLILRELLLPGDFIWEPEIADGFPSQTYWYLWGILNTEALPQRP